jgi:outer membrane protein OmpA-like peptidoglycan-associated protein
MKKSCVFLFLVAFMFSMNLFAQRKTDIENSKDYPMISRFEGAVIEFYKETKWGTYKLPVDDKGKIDWQNPKTLEGKVTRIQYTTSIDNNSEFVLQNYKTAFKKAGFTILIAIANEELGVSDRPHTWGDKYYVSGGYYNGLNNGKFGLGFEFPAWKNNHSFIAAKGKKDGKDIYAIIYTVVCDNFTLLTQDVIEVEAVETGMVTAENISKGINTEGHVAIYDILFETGKSEIKPESSNTLKTVAEYMNSNADKKFFIVGHTDNTGKFSENMSLSENRAKSVLNELTTKYAVNPGQLNAFGMASLSPVASNKSAEGAAKNRRVEIVEQ